MFFQPFGRKKNSPGAGGFTLLELVVVIAVMGFLAAIIAPFAGALGNSHRVKMTREKLDAVRTALLGSQNAYDGQGLRAVGGYVGDRDKLPLLHRSEWNNVDGCWEWPDRDKPENEILEDNTGTGQPLSLWEQVYGESGSWRGPYLSCPEDQFPGDTDTLSWDDPAEQHEFEMRQTGGKLADAWGRALLFWKEGTGGATTLWIISEGPDRKSGWRNGAGSPVPPGDPAVAGYDPDAPESKDDVVLKITPGEWYSPNQTIREEQTRRILEQIRNALTGPPGAFDSAGRRIVGGYTGDTGEWPKLYRWDGTGWVEDTAAEVRQGQPRGLWAAEGVPAGGNGFQWRGPYLPKPWGGGGEEVLRDAWGQPLTFKLMLSTSPQALAVTSSGRDKAFNTGDDIELVVQAGEWQAGGVTVKGYIINNDQAQGLDAEVCFYYQPGLSVSRTVNVPPGGGAPFGLSPPGYTCAGPRLVEAKVSNELKDSATVHIGPGGTQSPLPDKLTLTVQ